MHLKKCSLINEVIQADTVEIEDVPDEYYYYCRVEYRNLRGSKIKEIIFSGGDHGSSTTTKYYDQGVKLIYESEESSSVFGGPSVWNRYYNEKGLFVSIHQSSDSNEWDCKNFNHTYIPQIEIY